MSIEKPARYVIFGAGAIGSAIGGLMNLTGSRVLCVARPAQAEALNRGILIKRKGEDIRVRVDAITDLRDLTPESSDKIVVATKSQATESAVEELARVYDSDMPIVCLQNGVRNEEIAARRFNNVYAGLVFLSAVQLEPDLITLPQGRTIAVGRYPGGVDELSERFRDDLNRAGFDALASAYVMAMKWAKFVVNLNNATFAIIGYWVEQGMADAEVRRLMYEVRSEGLRVLDAAGIAIEPPAGEPSPLKVRETTEKLRREPEPSDQRDDLAEELRTYASMWQDLYLGRKSGEAEHLNGEVARLGKQHGVATPYNSTLLEVVNRMFEQQLKPGLYTPAQLYALARARS